MPNNLDALIAKLAAAECGSRELSDEVLKACGLEVTGFGAELRPSPTENVDDAIALIPGADPAGVYLRVFLERNPAGYWQAEIRPHGQQEGYNSDWSVPPALALCAALMCALQARP